MAAKAYIPSRTFVVEKSSHPWLNDRCKRLVLAKHAAVGTPFFSQRQLECSQGLNEEYEKYASKCRERLNRCNAQPRKWWRLSQCLLGRSVPVSSIPPLQGPGGVWVLDAMSKADLFSTTFAAKARLTEPASNHYSILRGQAGPCMSGFLPICVRQAKALLRKLRDLSSTGPDKLPAKILKQCADSLALPVTILARAVLNTGVWPQPWRFHWVFPLRKKKGRSNPENYRGIHLTPQFSKVVERLVGNRFLPFLVSTSAFGPNQFAYTLSRSLRDA